MRWRAARTLVPVFTASLIALAWSSASARPDGSEFQLCGNCHYESDGPMIDVVFGTETPAVGETISVLVQLQAVDAGALRTGLVLWTDGQGEFTLVEPESTHYTVPGELSAVSHSQPRELDGLGQAQFQFEWTAPDEPGVADFTAWSITGNSNGDSADDHFAAFTVSIAHGCDGVPYYPDVDGDGYGDEEAAQLSCEPIEGLIEQGGDCNDDEATVHPGAPELCNTRDDDCDGQLDEGLEPGLYYPDHDGDGYAVGDEDPVFTCNDAEGYTQQLGDCDPQDPDVYPGAPELPNGQDDDCDGEIDEVDEADDSGGSGTGGPIGDTDPALPGADGGTGSSGGCRVGDERGRAGALWVVVLAAAGLRRRRRAR